MPAIYAQFDCRLMCLEGRVFFDVFQEISVVFVSTMIIHACKHTQQAVIQLIIWIVREDFL